MMNVNTVKKEVNLIIEALARPLTAEDVRSGWNDNLRQRWHDWFVQIKAKLDADIPLKRNSVNAAYGIGYAGIQEGPLFGHAARVGSMLMEIANQT